MIWACAAIFALAALWYTLGAARALGARAWHDALGCATCAASWSVVALEVGTPLLGWDAGATIAALRVVVLVALSCWLLACAWIVRWRVASLVFAALAVGAAVLLFAFYL